MFARLTIIQVKIDRIDEASKLFEESVVPMFKSQQGYQGGFFLADRKSGKCICVSLWDSEKDAICNEQSLSYQEQLVKFMELFKAPPFREGYEVLVQD
jgi:heme-degrading monooxygenase HmoA